MILYDLSAKRGETFRQTIRYFDEERQPMDLTGQVGRAEIRETVINGPQEEVRLICEMDVFIDGPTGTVTLSIPWEKTLLLTTGIYQYDFCLINDGVSIYYLGGRFIVHPNVTDPGGGS